MQKKTHNTNTKSHNTNTKTHNTNRKLTTQTKISQRMQKKNSQHKH